MLSKEASPRTGFSAETGLPSTHLLSLFVVIGLMAHGDLLSLLSGQGLPLAVLTAHGGVYDFLLSAALQPGQQAEDVLGYVSSRQIRMLITTAAAAEFRMVISFIFSLQFLHQLHKLAHAHGAGQEFVSVPEHHIVAVLTPSGIFPGPS